MTQWPHSMEISQKPASSTQRQRSNIRAFSTKQKRNDDAPVARNCSRCFSGERTCNLLLLPLVAGSRNESATFANAHERPHQSDLFGHWSLPSTWRFVWTLSCYESCLTVILSSKFSFELIRMEMNRSIPNLSNPPTDTEDLRGQSEDSRSWTLFQARMCLHILYARKNALMNPFFRAVFLF